MKSEPTFSEITPNVDGSAAELAQSLFSHSGQGFETRASRIADAHADVLEFLSDRISTLEQDTDIATLRDAMLYFGNKLGLFSREAREDWPASGFEDTGIMVFDRSGGVAWRDVGIRVSTS